MTNNDLRSCHVLVTSTSYGKNDTELKKELETSVGKVIYNPLGKPLSSAELSELLPGIDGLIAGLDMIDRKALGSADRLKVIARYGVGLDRVDLQAAREKGVIVTNTPGANAVSVAELALGLILALARQIPGAVEATRAGKFPRLAGVTLQGKSIGILGMGAIGKQLIRRLVGFDCLVLVYEPFPDLEFAEQHHVMLLDQAAVISQVDFLSLHLPLTPETHGLVNREFLSRMKPGAFLVNTARGEIVEELALLESLENGHLGGAALDTFTQEPPPEDHPLLQFPNVIATPHIGAQTDGATNQMGRMALDDCLRVLRGEQPLFRVA
jgi:D-3-phosphoglycerate dehydrogenase